jgi:hypothetical protein
VKVFLSEDNKKLLKYLGIIFLAVLLGYKLPHDTYSIIQYIIRPLKFKGGGAIYLSGVIPLVLFIIGIKGLLDLQRFVNQSRILVFIAVIAIIIPMMKGILDFSRTSYHRIKGDKLQAVDIVDGNISLEGSDSKLVIKLKLELKDYSKGPNVFKVRVYLPKTLSKYTGKNTHQFEGGFVTFGNRSITSVEEKITVRIDKDYAVSSLFSSQWYMEDVKYELYNEKEVVKIMDRYN